MDTEKRTPLGNSTNVATVQPMQIAEKRLTGTKSKMPMPVTRVPRPATATPSQSQNQQQKRKASPVKENAYKRSRLDTQSTSSTSMKPPTSTVTASNAKKNVFSAKATTTKAVKPEPKPTRAVTNRAAKKPAMTSRPPRMSEPKPQTTSMTGLGGGKKRAAWDYKGRLEDMQELMREHMNQNSSLQMQMSLNDERISMLEKQRQNLEVQTKDRSQEVEQLQDKLRRSEETHYEEVRLSRRRIEDLEFTRDSLQRQKTSLEGELSARQAEVCGLKTSLSEVTSAQEAVRAELEVNQMNLEKALADAREKAGRISELEGFLAEREAEVGRLQERLMEEESIRRKMHNDIQELKGNIRVFCRVRPLIKQEGELQGGEIPHICFNGEKSLELEKLADSNPNETCGNRKSSSKYEFEFDKVFVPESTQEEVFSEISQLVQSSLDGYNVCIFAYGQTGSGKTFTMEGPDDLTPETRGMIPRAVEQVFVTADQLTSKGWQYQMEASFLEIYNETIRDLLGSNADDVKHEIKMVANNSQETMVTNLTTVVVKGQEQVERLLKKASENRAVAETRCNERSSRSHSVFRLKITGHNSKTEEKCTGVLNLIDLAGSERLKDSGSQGARLKETLSINKSLSNLGNVIMALANKESHIPYRNSKLTHLLQNSLGGNSKTLMFVNVSPREENFSESLNSLRFATKVNNCSIGTATKKLK